MAAAASLTAVRGNAPATPAEDAAALPPGHGLKEYRIEKTLGGGGFGITYLAKDINLELPVAIKEYFPGDMTVRASDHTVRVRAPEAQAAFQEGLERFLDEARALASFRHPNIVRVLRYFRENGTAYIVMEYESGDPLRRWLAHQPALDRARLLRIILPLLDGLEAVHRLDFLHRDIKPDNIYIRGDGTPVLLDFGAARRTSGGRALTSIVSPGFAPFEQYHSQGKQGPWSDIYALGAVMYWMSTGQKPLDSAARVDKDSLPPALAVGNISIFGARLLQVIDWALSPEVQRRPQNVAELRQALLAAGPAQPIAGSGHALPAPDVRNHVLATVMSLGLVAYARHQTEQQLAIRERFNQFLGKALKGTPQASHVLIDTDGGASACFLGDPEEALQSALLLRSLLTQKYGRMLSLRIGVHLGPIRIVSGSGAAVQVVGDGINVAQRIMDFAQPNQIVVSQAYHDLITLISDHAVGLFTPLGPHLDKHLRSHEIHAVLESPVRPAAPVAGNRAFENTASLATLSPLTPELLIEVEAELARHIGPLARVLLKKALPRSASAQGLRELLAVSIPNARARQAFVQPKRPASHTSRPTPATSGRSRPAPTPPPGPAAGESSMPLARPWCSAAQLSQLERALSLAIGPLSRMLVKKHLAQHHSLEALRQALAGEIDAPGQRDKFLAATQTLF